MTNKPVKMQELKKVLCELRFSFMNWDDERRKKVDIMLLALQINKETIDLGLTLEHIDWLAVRNPDYLELATAAKKMLRLQYLELNQSDIEKAKDQKRVKRAQDKLETFKEKGIL